MGQEEYQETGFRGQPEGPPERPQRPAPAPRARNRMHGCLIALATVGALGIVFVLGIGLLSFVGTMAVVSQGAVVDEEFRFEEVTVGGVRGQPKVVGIPIKGIISGSALPGMEVTPAALLAAQLSRAKSDHKVSGVILYVDSPGGGITASDIIHREIESFRTNSGGKPVVACLMDVAASGGYYVSVAADRIIAHPTTITGSIGVMMPLYDATALMNKIGVKDETITTGPFKGVGSPLKEKDEQQKAMERKMLEGIIAEMYERFISVVAEGRGIEPEKVRLLADGRIFTSEQAKGHGLIDQIGYEEHAVAAIKELAGIAEVHLVRYRRIVPLSEILRSYVKGPTLTLDVAQDVRPSSMRPMFLWVPPVPGQARLPSVGKGAASAP